MQEITLPIWVWRSKGIEPRAYILLQFWKFIIFCILGCSCTDEIEKGGSLQ